jgi:hypothetical protein
LAAGGEQIYPGNSGEAEVEIELGSLGGPCCKAELETNRPLQNSYALIDKGRLVRNTIE